LQEFQVDEIKDLLKQFPDVIDAPLGRVKSVKHRIEIMEENPRRQRPHPMSQVKLEEVNRQVDYMLQRGIIRKSKSPYASPILLREKPDGSWRFCVDYRQISSLTSHDSFPIPRVQDLLRRLATAKYISTMDAEKGYWQIEMDRRSKKCTAFCTNRGLFEYNCMPFGLKNAPATYQRMMNELLGELGEFCLVYQDDVLVFSKTFAEHKKHLKAVLEKFREAGLTLTAKKCQFGKSSVKFLGHVVSSKGIGMNPEKVDAIKACLVPTTRRQLRAFLGMIGWYSNFVERYADLAKPLYELTKPSRKFRWTPEANKAFQGLKNAIIYDLVLAHPIFGKPFILRTDASNYGVGAVLSQIDESGAERAVSFASKVLDKAQINYTTSEKECYAIVYSLEKFREYLEGHEYNCRRTTKP
jgi:hypothetical protein